MTDTEPFAELLLIVGGTAVAAILSNRLTARLLIPAPALFLAAAAAAAAIVPALGDPPRRTVERVVTVALLCILFDGGLQIGRRRFRAAAWPIVTVGVVGTFLCTGAVAVLAHVAIGLDWYVAVLLGTAVAPTDPAVVFSILGQREIAGRSGTILEGESGTNDPVGIALMASLLAAGSLGSGALADTAGQFCLQMGVGAAVGVVGGRALLWFMRRVPLPNEGLYPLRSVASVLVLYGGATLAHGSGFLAVFVAGIVIADERAPFKREVERFHAVLASLGEIVAFVALGLTVDLDELTKPEVWGPGLLVGASLAVVLRPALVGLCLIPARLQRNEAAFVLFAGLKGAVPILLAELVVDADVPEANRLYSIVIVVVAFSVVVQGSLVPTVARALRLDMRTHTLEPWALGVRLAEEPEGVLLLTVAAGSGADGTTVDEVADRVAGDDGLDVWVNLLVRDRASVSVRGDTQLRADDKVLITADARCHPSLERLFGAAGAHGTSAS